MIRLRVAVSPVSSLIQYLMFQDMFTRPEPLLTLILGLVDVSATAEW